MIPKILSGFEVSHSYCTLDPADSLKMPRGFMKFEQG